MCNGSKASKPKLVQSSKRQAALARLALGLLLLGAGCQRASLPPRTDLRQAMGAVNAEQLFHEGVVHARLGDFLRAEQYLTAARARGYDETEIVSWLVRICVTSNRYHSALAHAEPYLRRNPHDWPLRFVVANLYDALGDTERAGAELRAVVAAAPDEPLPQYRLAVFYSERSVARDEAQQALENYIRLDPSGRYAAEARARLERGPQWVDAARRVPYSELRIHGEAGP